jgi:hypothetical protein
VISACCEAKTDRLSTASPCAKTGVAIASSGRFGTWETALWYSGVSKQRLPRGNHGNLELCGDSLPDTEKADAQDIQRRLRELQARGLPLVYSLLVFEHQSLLDMAVSCFGTWRKALVALGVNQPPHRSAPWTREAVLAEIRAVQARGCSMRCKDVRADQSGLVCAARHYFRKWSDAVAAAGEAASIADASSTPTGAADNAEAADGADQSDK